MRHVLSVLSRVGHITQTTPVVPDVDGVSDGSSTLPASIKNGCHKDSHFFVVI